MNNSAAPITQGIHHLGLTVADITVTKDFFMQHLNFSEVGGKPDYPAVFISDGTVMLTLWQIKDSQKAVSFNRHHNIGLHHFALNMVNKAALQALYEKFVTLNEVTIEFAPEALGESAISHMMCFIPGGVRVEFIAS